MATENITKVRKNTKIQAPKMWNVVFLNDDVTPMDLVIDILITIFNHGHDSAKEITLKIHTEGKAVAGTYSYQISEQKALEATELARKNRSPLKINLEEVK